MFNKSLFIFAHQLGDPLFYSTYREAVKNQWKTYDELKQDQEKNLRHMIRFAYKNVPFYHKLFNNLKLNPTGGSTGTPLVFRVSNHDRFIAGALLYRGWGYAGYELGDKMAFLAGAALDIGKKSSITTKAHEITRNLKKLSSFDMGIQEMENYTKIINSFNPRFLRGYASSIDFFAKYVNENNKQIEFDAVFTTAEKLYPHMRENIGNAFSCDVFDCYGLYDGGAGAYECQEHNGLHMDTERSVMEVVDENGFQIENGVGRIIATSLHNFAMPFIRYDTGDLGNLVKDVCGCGRQSKLLKEVVGRQQEMLQTPEGKFVHGEFFTHIFWEIRGVKEFQVIQTSLENIVVKIVADQDFDRKQLDTIRSIVKNRSEKWNLEFKFVDQIERTKAGKYKFIISELCE